MDDPTERIERELAELRRRREERAGRQRARPRTLESRVEDLLGVLVGEEREGAP